jgi:hypothetical protein
MFQTPYYWRPLQELMLEKPFPALEFTACDPMVPHIQAMGSDVVIAEVGVAFGINLINLLEKCDNISRCYAIDSWCAYQDWGDVTQCPHGAMPDNVMKGVKGKFDENMAAYPKSHKVTVIHEQSDYAHEKLEPCDFIFIDANHAEAHVYLDVTNYYPKVKPGGILCGHDWDAAQVITGVEKALVTLGIPKSELVTESPPGGTPPIWWVRKPKE